MMAAAASTQFSTFKGGLTPLKLRSSAPRPSAVRLTRRSTLTCRASGEPSTSSSPFPKFAMPLVGAVAAALIAGAVVPEDALAAKSSGRVGGSSGFAARRAAPPAAANKQTNVVVNNYSAPPVYGGWGFGGFTFVPTFFVPVGGGVFSIIFLMMGLALVFSVVSAVVASKSNNKDLYD